MSKPAPPGDVVVGVDGSSNSLAALDVAVGEAIRRHAELTVVYATVCAHPHSNPPRLPTTVTDRIARLQGEQPELAVTARIAPQLPANMLVEASRHAAIVIVGRPTDDQEHHRLHDATAASLEQRALCSVLEVPRAEEAAERGAAAREQPRRAGGRAAQRRGRRRQLTS